MEPSTGQLLDEEIDERLSSQETRDNLRLLDFIADKIGLPHNQELSRENFLAWISGRRGESVGADVSDIERERTKEINKELAPTAFELAWHAFQHTGIDLVADSDDETCKCLHNAIVAYLAATGRNTDAPAALKDAHDHLKAGIADMKNMCIEPPMSIYKAMHALTYAIREEK